MIHLRTYWVRLPLLLLATLLVGACGDQGTQPGAPAAGSPASSPAAAAGDGATVSVAASEFAFALDAAQLAAGPVTFLVKNEGRAIHDFQIQGAGVSQQTEMIDGGGSASLTVDLPPGSYTFRCTVGGHEMLGMKGTLTVNQ